jgi:hypothetical protein
MLAIMIFLCATIPLPAAPNWESTDNDYSTGGALVDVDRDGDLDFVTGNGNDMAQNPNRVYNNRNDTLPHVASWSSADVGYHAHIALGDINYDGYPELAVTCYGDPYTPQFDKLYANLSGTFQTTPSWRPHDRDNSFACAFGDVDRDGDLDLAMACGEEYGDSLQRAKVYRNQNGFLDTLPIWQSNLQSYFYDAVWVDIDRDGDLDLALAANHKRTVIYRNTAGTLESTPYWQSADSMGTLKIAFGDVDNDGDPDMACANNAQTGGVSNCRVYLNTGTTLATTPAWTSSNRQYYSCVAFGDADRDGDLDLAAGGWWEPVGVFENAGGGSFPATYTWSWLPSPSSDLVCENISFGDVDNTLPVSVANEAHFVDSTKRVFYLNQRWIRNVTRVRRSAGDLNRNQYCFSYTDGWISVANIVAQPETIWVDYTYSRDLDLIVTNWVGARGNFLFLNTMGTGVEELAGGVRPKWRIESPNRGRFEIGGPIGDCSYRVYDAAGRLVQSRAGKKVSIPNAGIYFLAVYDGGRYVGTRKVVVVK